MQLKRLLEQENVHFVFGPFLSNVFATVLPYAKEFNGKFLMMGGATRMHEFVGKPDHDFLIRTWNWDAGPNGFGERMIDDLIATAHPKKVAILTGGENSIYLLPDNSYVLGTRTPLNGVLLPVGTSIGAPTCATGANGNACVLPNGQTAILPFGNDSYFITGGYSAYNSLQINWRHTSGRLQMLMGYTFSKSLDNSSGYGEQYNPINPRLSRGLSAFDSTNNFVVSYSYSLPFDKLDGPKKLTNGWQISGITRFSTGLPVTIVRTMISLC